MILRAVRPAARKHRQQGAPESCLWLESSIPADTSSSSSNPTEATGSKLGVVKGLPPFEALVRLLAALGGIAALTLFSLQLRSTYNHSCFMMIDVYSPVTYLAFAAPQLTALLWRRLPSIFRVPALLASAVATGLSMYWLSALVIMP
jgi:hypothetical protein